MSVEIRELLERGVDPGRVVDVASAWRRGRLLRRRRAWLRVSLAAVTLGVVAGAVAFTVDLRGGSAPNRVAIGSGGSNYRDEERGVTVRIPPGWQRATKSLTGLVDPVEVLALSTFPIPPSTTYDPSCDNQLPRSVVDALRPSDAFVWLLESKAESSSSTPRPEKFDLQSGDAWPCGPASLPAGVQARWIYFAQSGRAFYAAVIIGPEAPAERQAEAFAILDSLNLRDPGSVTASTTRPSFRSDAAPAVDPAAPEPPTFFAAFGAGGERVALTSSSDGEPQRFLTPPSQALVRFSPDGKTVYSPTIVGCGRTWTAYDVTTGASRPAYEDYKGAVDVAESPDGRKVAYVSDAGAAMQTGCGKEHLVVKELATGRLRVWDVPADPTGQARIVQLEWSPDSTNLTFRDVVPPGVGSSTVWVLNINRGTSITDGIALVPPRPECRLEAPRFRPGTNHVVVAQNCERSSASLLDFDATTGAFVSELQVATGDVYGIIDLSIDASGQHVLYVVSSLSSKPSELFVLQDGQPHKLADDVYQVHW